MDWDAEGLLDDCADGDARAARLALLDKLHADGVQLDDLRLAVAEERLALLPVERLLRSAPPVKLVKQIGDAVMLVAPGASELVATALALVEASDGEDLPALRAGIAFGPAVNRWGDWYGSSVDVASRLTERARPASVVVTEAVREAAGHGYDWSYAGEKKLKGLSAPLKTYRARALTATSDG